MKELGIGIIGAGGIAQSCHMPAYASMPHKCRLVAVADLNPEVARQAATKFGIDKVFADYHDLLALPDIDAVTIATPNAFHMQPTIDALNAGKHVLCEKPMAMNAQECRRMLEAQRNSGKILQIGLQFRFSSAGRFMKEFIEHGKMGDIYYARAQALRRRGVPGWGVFIDKEKQGGGPLIDIGVHILDFTLFLMNYPRPVTVSGVTYQAMATNPKYWNAWGDYDRSKFTVEDFAVGIIRCANGATVTIETSFMANIQKEIMTTQLFGTESGALINLFGDKPIEIYAEFDKQLFDMTPVNLPTVESTYTDEVAAFLDAIFSGSPSPVPGEHGFMLNAIFDALYKSAESGHDEPVESLD